MEEMDASAAWAGGNTLAAPDPVGVSDRIYYS